ncbi:hypothetical protein F2Q69_00027297 [Brassica cretica]|uniref:Uncharacterized protein n=1 Tax=Brassica cretica TaxID=69181 RepID=A0A8S9S1L7_BRACR|nr:hypothetical protein F2Q69_00027297 [Brassica cretica]
MELQIYLLDFTPLFSIYIHRLKTIEVWVLSTRLFRFSEAQNVKKGSELICVAMVLIDSKIRRPNCELIPKECFRFQKYERLMSLESGVEPNINAKLVGGRLFMNATSGTNLYLDNKCGGSSSFIKEIEVWVLSTRLFRFSEAQNVKKGSELICVAMVLIDSKATELSVLDIS